MEPQSTELVLSSLVYKPKRGRWELGELQELSSLKSHLLVQNVYASRVCTISNLILGEALILSTFDIVWSNADVEKKTKRD